MKIFTLFTEVWSYNGDDNDWGDDDDSVHDTDIYLMFFSLDGTLLLSLSHTNLHLELAISGELYYNKKG